MKDGKQHQNTDEINKRVYNISYFMAEYDDVLLTKLIKGIVGENHQFKIIMNKARKDYLKNKEVEKNKRVEILQNLQKDKSRGKSNSLER